MIVPREYWSTPPPPGLAPSFAPFANSSPDPRKPQPFRTLLIVDVSLPMIRSGAVNDVCDSLRNVVFSPSMQDGSLVGIMMFASALTFFDLSVCVIILPPSLPYE